jgi:hypothetical protein
MAPPQAFHSHGGTCVAWSPGGYGSRERSRAGAGRSRAAMVQHRSKVLILWKIMIEQLSKSLILRAHEIGTFCIDCTGTPGGKIKALWEERLKARPSLRRVQMVSGALCRTPEVLVHQRASMTSGAQLE